MLRFFCAVFLAMQMSLGTWADIPPRARESVAAWQERSIYQIVTDRFGRSDGDTSACNDLRQYCGGTWRGITRNLDYIKELGFNAIWISPISHNMDQPFLPKQGFWGAGYHGYWVDDWTRLNPHFGTEDDLKELVEESHKRDIWVMLDVVANHGIILPAYPGHQEEHPINPYVMSTPFNKTEYYHEYKLKEDGLLVQGTAWDHCRVCSNYTSESPDKTAACMVGYTQCLDRLSLSQYHTQVCWSGGLADLNQDHPFVRSFLLQWISDLQKKIGFDGLRVDTQPYVANSFWAEFRFAANDVFTLGEATTANVSYLKSRVGYPYGLDSALSYPLYYAIVDAFGSGPDYILDGENFPGEGCPLVGPRRSLWQVSRVLEEHNRIMPFEGALGNFVENHDQPRFLFRQPNVRLLRNALTLIYFIRGMPIIYYGMEKGFTGRVNASFCNTSLNDGGYPQTGGDPCPRQPFWMEDSGPSYSLLKFVRRLNRIRREEVVGKGLMTTHHKTIYVRDDLLIFRRGHLLVIVTNTEREQSFCLKMSWLDIPYGVDAKFENLLDPYRQVIDITSRKGQHHICLATAEPMLLAVVDESRAAFENQALVM